MGDIRELVSATIRDLTRQWLDEGTVTRVREIGNGLCEEFAQEALDRIHAADPHTIDIVAGAFTDDWWMRETDVQGRDLGRAVSFAADIPRLRAEGAPLPDDLTDGELSDLVGCATHMWIVHDGVHYDATAPDGAAHFLLMPFFADQIAGYRADQTRRAA
jgi:hypothetical protein